VYIIGMNGPPRSGKDTIAHGLAAVIEDRHGTQPQLLALSQPMRDTVFAMMGMQYDHPFYEAWKDRQIEALNGSSIRQAMIALSEEHIKPRYGNDFWNHSLMNRIWSDVKVVIITDYGFQFEPEFFENKVNHKNHAVVQLNRNGRSYDGDSRSYVRAANLLPVPNHGTLDDIPVAVNRIYTWLTRQLQWEF
jgi:tRNA uridine 5-carbamoylmethylation protein Kti12